MPTIDISGGGGAEGGLCLKETPDLESGLNGLMEWTTPILTEIPYTDELRRLYAEAEPEEKRLEQTPVLTKLKRNDEWSRSSGCHCVRRAGSKGRDRL